MRWLCGVAMAAMLLGSAGSLQAQAAANAKTGPVGSWDDVKNLPTGQPMRVKTQHHAKTCEFVSADEVNLVCSVTHTVFFFPVTERNTIPKVSVVWIKRSHQTRSRLLAALIGAGLGAAIGAAIDPHDSEDPGLVVLLFAGLGGSIGNAVGAGTDFLANPVIYRVP